MIVQLCKRVILCSALLCTTVVADEVVQRIYNNEKAITFTANSGEQTAAFEGHLMVPENRNNKNSRLIRVNYVRFPATGTSRGAPIVYLAGGPGGSGIGTAKWRRFPLFMAMREFADVIALDQRGAGASEQPEPCQSDVHLALDKRWSKTQLKAAYHEAATQCLTRWQKQGIDVYGYTTVQNALDIDDLRQHLQADKVNLWGISYGSHLAMAAMKLFPNQINKVVLASAEGPDQTVKLPLNTQRYFERVQQVIDQQSLKETVPDLQGLMMQVHASLEKKPVLVELKGGQKMLFQSHHMRMLAAMMIADPGRYLSYLIHLYLDLAQGNTEQLAGVLNRGIFESQLSFKLMELAMDVASGISATRLAQVEQQAATALLQDYLNFPMPMLNNMDDKLDLGTEFRKVLKSDIPTLLFTGTLDGRTTVEGQKQAVRGLSQLTHVLVHNAGHNLFTASPEVLQMMRDFMADKAITKTDIQLPVPSLLLR